MRKFFGLKTFVNMVSKFERITNWVSKRNNLLELDAKFLFERRDERGMGFKTIHTHSHSYSLSKQNIPSYSYIFSPLYSTACSVGWWLMAGAGLF
jgi:hypothetical protein